MPYLARIYVTPKPGVNDPQGSAILGGLKSLGYGGGERVRAGKYLEGNLEARRGRLPNRGNHFW